MKATISLLVDFKRIQTQNNSGSIIKGTQLKQTTKQSLKKLTRVHCTTKPWNDGK